MVFRSGLVLPRTHETFVSDGTRALSPLLWLCVRSYSLNLVTKKVKQRRLCLFVVAATVSTFFQAQTVPVEHMCRCTWRSAFAFTWFMFSWWWRCCFLFLYKRVFSILSLNGEHTRIGFQTTVQEEEGLAECLLYSSRSVFAFHCPLKDRVAQLFALAAPCDSMDKLP